MQPTSIIDKRIHHFSARNVSRNLGVLKPMRPETDVSFASCNVMVARSDRRRRDKTSMGLCGVGSHACPSVQNALVGAPSQQYEAPDDEHDGYGEACGHERCFEQEWTPEAHSLFLP